MIIALGQDARMSLPLTTNLVNLLSQWYDPFRPINRLACLAACGSSRLFGLSR